CGVIDTLNGNIVSYNSSIGILTVACHSGTIVEYTSLNNGSWLNKETCPSLLQDIRLVDGVVTSLIEQVLVQQVHFILKVSFALEMKTA
ncbi:hypothetical protein MAR_016441, partial [Mya arenaria]